MTKNQSITVVRDKVIDPLARRNVEHTEEVSGSEISRREFNLVEKGIELSYISPRLS